MPTVCTVMAASSQIKASKDLYQCYRLFQVEESSPVAGGETPFHSFDVPPTSASTSIAIEHCCYKETQNYSILVLVCNNGYIVLRIEPFFQPPILKQLKWFEGRNQHILDITIDPFGEWLACACLDGCVYLVPILTLMMPDCNPSHVFGPLEDIVKAEPIHKVSPPTSIVWWETIDGGQICITGSELGEITFFNLYELKEIQSVTMRGCIDQLLLAQQSDNTAHLLINLRGGEWWWMLLEERYHEAAGISYSDVQASGFEVVYDDAVLRSFLVRPELPSFEPKIFQDFTEFAKLSTQEWKDLHMLGAVNLRDSHFELYSYSFELCSGPIRSFKLFEGTTSVLATERMLFAISHNDESNDCSFTLSIISSELAQRNAYELPSNAAIQQFIIPSNSAIVGFFTTILESCDLASESRDLTQPTNLGGCIIVTSTAVYQCRQIRSPESVFLEIALSNKSHHLTDEVAIKYRLDICGLYRAAAKYKLACKQYNAALMLFEQAKCSASEVIECFIGKERIPELLSFLQEAVYDESNLTPSTKPQYLQNVLFKCFVHQYLESTDPAQIATLKVNLTQFINDKFLYDHMVAMETLIQCGMKEQLIELAKTHHKVPEVLKLLVTQGSSSVQPTLESTLTTKQFAEHLATAEKGLVLYQLSPINFAKCVIAQPSILECHLPHLLTCLCHLDLMMLVRVIHLLDPSHSTIRPLLQQAYSSMKRSSSTGSIVSVISTDNESTGMGANVIDSGPGPSFHSYIEAFILSLIILNYKRERQPPPSAGLFALSPLVDRLNSTPEEQTMRPLATFADGSKIIQNHVVSCGYNHAALVSNGDLYTWGSTRNGKLGHGDIEQQPLAAPLKVETFSMLSIRVLAVSCGAEHTVALCQEGVYSWGSSTHGQLGLGDTLKRSLPVQIALLANITMVTIVCGQYHCLALDENHWVWSWGWGVHGQLGLGFCDDVLTPTHATEMDDLVVSFIAAGFNHSAVISKEGKLFTFGNGMYGQLGHGHQEKQSYPCLVQALADKIVYLVGCGTSHTVAVCTDQSVYYWGKNLHKPHPANSPQGLRHYTRSRREGSISPAVANALQPILMQGLDLNDVITQIGCGNSHCLLLSVSGSVLSWGSNVHGQIGHTHIPELSQPKNITKLENHKILTLSAGDEFSIALDDAGIAWVWGRDDLGQLGMEFTHGVREGRKVCIFAPNPNPQIPKVPCAISAEPSPLQTRDDNFLELDLDWNLPDFALIGPSRSIYGHDALTRALHDLHGYYRSSHVLEQCNQWEDWRSMIEIFTVEKQWSQVLLWSLHNLASYNKVQVLTVLPIIEECLTNLISETISCHSRQFILNTTSLLKQILKFWEDQALDISSLEHQFTNFLSPLAYPLSLLLTSDDTPRLSFQFSLAVTVEVVRKITAGVPPVEEILQQHPDMKDNLSTNSPTDTNSDSHLEKLPIETSPRDSRLWTEVLRNLSKNLAKRENLIISSNSLHQLEVAHQKAIAKQEKISKTLLVFSCGHTFLEGQFHNKVLFELHDRLQDLPRPLVQTTSLLLHYYKHASCFSSACPYCVFKHLRKSQLHHCPGVPIKPWNP